MNVSSLCMQLSKRVCVCVCEGVCKRVCLSLHALMCVCVSACVCVCVCMRASVYVFSSGVLTCSSQIRSAISMKGFCFYFNYKYFLRVTQDSSKV